MVSIKASVLVSIVALLAIFLQFPRTLDLPFDTIDKVINWAQGADPAHNWALSGNYAPVLEEVFVTDLPVTTGQFPTDLEGLFLRIGPNPHLPVNGGYHWFDGDGMLHAVRFKGGKVNYSNEFMETNRLRDERTAKRNIYPRIGSTQGITGILKQILFIFQTWLGLVGKHDKYTTSTANTATLYHHGNLFALNEASLPFSVQVGVDGKIFSKGYDLKEWNYPFTAHPKIDPETGNLLFFGYQLSALPYVRYGMADKNGKILNTLDINTISQPIMMHDFAITKHYSIVMDLPLIFWRENMVSGGYPFFFNKTRGSRFGIFPHSAESESEIRWFPAESCFIFHTCNAWEEGEEVVLVASRFENFDLGLESTQDQDIWEYRFDMKTGKTAERRIFKGEWDFPQIHPNLTGQKNRFAYFTIIDQIRFPGLTKADLEKKNFTEFIFGGKKFGGEAIFVPKKNPVTEDDGYLLLIVHDEESGKSSFWVMDAVQLVPLATVELPQRVPYGFHARYLTEQELEEMNVLAS